MTYSNLFAVLVDSIAIADVSFSFNVSFRAVQEDGNVLH